MLALTLTLLSLPLLSIKPNPLAWTTTSSTLLLLTLLSLVSLLTPMQLPLTTSLHLSLDLMSATLSILTIWMTALMTLMSPLILTTNHRPKLFLTSLTTLALSLIMFFATNNLLNFYILFETSLIPTLLLILIWGYQPERLQAGKYLMLYTVTSSLPLLLNINSLFHANLHMNIFNPIWSHPLPPSLTSSIWWLLTTAAFYVKMPMFFTHLWLPKAHVEAPVSGSMILASILLKLGSYGLIRLTTLFPPANIPLLKALIPICMCGGILTSLTCLRHPDLKALIAYSSIGHMALLTGGLLASNLWGWCGTLALMLSHGLCSSALFSLANISYLQTNTRSLLMTKGLLTTSPQITFWWFIFSAINMAAPPSINLLSEISLITSLMSKSSTLTPLLATLAFLAAAYSLHLYTASQHGHLPPTLNPCSPLPPSYFLPLLLHFAPNLFLILKPDLITHWT